MIEDKPGATECFGKLFLLFCIWIQPVFKSFVNHIYKANSGFVKSPAKTDGYAVFLLEAPYIPGMNAEVLRCKLDKR